VEKIFADALAWSASIAVHRAAVPCETPGAWQLPLLFGALPSWERALEKEWSNPSFDHLQLRKTKEKEKKSFSRLPRFNPKLSAYGLRPIAHNFGPHRDFTRSLLSFLLLKNLPPPPLPRVTPYPLYCHIYGQVAYSSGTLRGRER
jgi:hypothetical protein